MDLAVKKGFSISKQMICDSVDLPLDQVFVPEWAGGNEEAYVMIKALTAKEKAMFEDSVITPSSKGTKKLQMDMIAYGPKLAALSICDDDGNRLFGLEEVSILEGKSAKALDRVIKAAMKLNGISSGSAEDAAKNSTSTQSEDSPTN